MRGRTSASVLVGNDEVDEVLVVEAADLSLDVDQIPRRCPSRFILLLSCTQPGNEWLRIEPEARTVLGVITTTALIRLMRHPRDTRPGVVRPSASRGLFSSLSKALNRAFCL